MEVMVERCGALDIGKDEVVGCARTPSPSGRGRSSELRTFSTFTSGLEDLADWLRANGIVEVVMEATGQYWKPVWYVLEATSRGAGKALGINLCHGLAAPSNPEHSQTRHQILTQSRCRASGNTTFVDAGAVGSHLIDKARGTNRSGGR